MHSYSSPQHSSQLTISCKGSCKHLLPIFCFLGLSLQWSYNNMDRQNLLIYWIDGLWNKQWKKHRHLVRGNLRHAPRNWELLLGQVHKDMRYTPGKCRWVACGSCVWIIPEGFAYCGMLSTEWTISVLLLGMGSIWRGTYGCPLIRALLALNGQGPERLDFTLHRAALHKRVFVGVLPDFTNA